MKIIQNFINGAYVAAQSGEYLPNYNPATGQIYAQLPDSDARDIELAYLAANEAFYLWRKTSSEKRFKILNRIAEIIDNKNEELAIAESIDQGKPLWLARTEITRSAQNFRFFASAAIQFNSDCNVMDGHAINYTLKTPIGVVGCISPWNLPLYLLSWKIAPALATGNCVIAKPSEITPMTAYLLGEICNEAGLPKGVLNIVHGLGHKVGNDLVSHPEIKAISFTGGTNTGKHIASVAAPQFKKLSLELGGKNPNLIFADCDFEKAATETLRSSFLNQGEICLCGSRILIERPIYEKFKAFLLEKLNHYTVGNPLLDETQMGAIVSEQHFEKILNYIEIAKQEGGKILFGGEALKPKGFENGWYIAPTVIENLSQSSRCNQEEIFGPVVTLTPFDSDEEALDLANGTPYGLASSIWTNNLQRAHVLASELSCGIVWINCWLLRDLRTPFGGMKQSGVGREGGLHAMNFFTEQKNVCVKL